MITERDRAIEAAGIEYQAGGVSINSLAIKHGIPEPTLRRIAKQRGWVKGSSEAKRELVREALAGNLLPDDSGATNSLTNDENDERIRQAQISEATQDVRDMNDGLSVARKCMRKLLCMVDAVEDPKEVKTIVEANKIAIDTIRKIRSLDDEQPPETTVSVTVDDGFAELRAAFRKRLDSMNTANVAPNPAG